MRAPLRALTLALGLSALLAPLSSAAPTSQTAGPGLGDSPAQPAGTPLSLRLPPGYQLVSIVGGATFESQVACFGVSGSESVPPECAYARGTFDLTLILAFDPGAYTGNNSNRDACVGPATWSGWVLPSADGAAQNLLIPIDVCATADGAITPVFDLPPPTPATSSSRTLNLFVAGYCLNLSRSVPGEEHAFSPGVVTDDPGLVSIMQAIAGKNLTLFASRFTIQDVIWDWVDFVKSPDSRLSELQALP